MPAWEDEDDDFDDDPVDADSEDSPTYPCPGCGQSIYEEADACPYCGEYLAFDDPHAGDKKWWIYLAAGLALLGMLGGLLAMLAALIL